MLTFIKKTRVITYKKWWQDWKWLFLCSYCNKETEVSISSSKRVKSCWCIAKQLTIETKQKKSEESKVIIDNWSNIEFSLTNWWYCIIDKEDYDKVKWYSWYKSVRWYAEARIKWKLVKLHRLLTNVKDWILIDHINRNKLDNRKSNLREATTEQNLRNTTQRTGKYKWVYKDKKWKYIARCQSKHIWSFLNENDAAIAYNEVAIKEFAEFAFLNIIK